MSVEKTFMFNKLNTTVTDVLFLIGQMFSFPEKYTTAKLSDSNLFFLYKYTTGTS